MSRKFQSISIVGLLTFMSCLSGCVSASKYNLIDVSAALKQRDHLPNLVLSSLDGRDMELPRDFAGDMNVLVFGFSHDQKDTVQEWASGARELSARFPELIIYKVPVIDTSNAALRLIIRNAMRAGTDGQELSTTLPLFVEGPQLRRALGLSEGESPAAILVNRTGEVLWKAEGAKSETSMRSLVSTLTTSLGLAKSNEWSHRWARALPKRNVRYSGLSFGRSFRPEGYFLERTLLRIANPLG